MLLIAVMIGLYKRHLEVLPLSLSPFGILYSLLLNFTEGVFFSLALGVVCLIEYVTIIYK